MLRTKKESSESSLTSKNDITNPTKTFNSNSTSTHRLPDLPRHLISREGERNELAPTPIIVDQDRKRTKRKSNSKVRFADESFDLNINLLN